MVPELHEEFEGETGRVPMTILDAVRRFSDWHGYPPSRRGVFLCVLTIHPRRLKQSVADQRTKFPEDLQQRRTWQRGDPLRIARPPVQGLDLICEHDTLDAET